MGWALSRQPASADAGTGKLQGVEFVPCSDRPSARTRSLPLEASLPYLFAILRAKPSVSAPFAHDALLQRTLWDGMGKIRRRGLGGMTMAKLTN